MANLKTSVTDAQMKVITKIEEAFPSPEFEIIVSEVLKDNDITLTGVTIRPSESTTAPTVYVPENGFTDKEVDTLIENVRNGLSDIPDIATSLCKEYILENASLRLLNAETNKAFYGRPLEDLKLVPIVIVESGPEKEASFKVTPKILAEYGISEDEFFEAAEKNVSENAALKSVLEEFKEILLANGVPEEEIDDMLSAEDTRMFVLTNKSKQYGAASIVSGKLAELSEKLDDDLYVLPSSVHEMLAVPAEGIDDISFLTAMVRDVNDNGIAPCDLLSYNVYKFSRETKKFEIAATA